MNRLLPRPRRPRPREATFLALLLLFGASFLGGRAAARLTLSGSGVSDPDSPPVFSHLQTGASASSGGSWGLSFQEKGKTPVGNASAEYLQAFHACYVGDPSEPVVYLTFDAGYENGNTAPILDALAKHRAPAAFFVVGNYLETSPDLVRRMAEEGHIVANHTYHHPDMSALSDPDDFSRELTELEELYTEITGLAMRRYYRPPQGLYSEENLKMADRLGYKTFFWSLAYVDWLQDQQPDPQEAIEKLCERVHPGAVVLLHSTSETNARILDGLLTRFEQMGYRFGSLDELAEKLDAAPQDAPR